MDKQAFKQRMQNLKSYRENNPGKGYWDWKVTAYADGGEVKDDRTDHSIAKPIIPENIERIVNGKPWSQLSAQEQFMNRSGYSNGRPLERGLELVHPEFDILSSVRGVSSTVKGLMDTVIGRKLPTDYAYRRTTANELKDIVDSNSFRSIPDNVNLPTKTFTTASGKTVTFGKKKGNSHGVKAFSAGEPWKATTASGDKANEIIIGIPGDNAKWMTGFHGNYEGPFNFKDINKGTGIAVPFNEQGIADISTKGLKVFGKPSKYFSDRYLAYADGGQTGDPDKERFYQATGRSRSGRPLEEGLKPVFDLEDAANMTPIGDAISAKDTYDAVKNRDWLGAGLAASAMIPFIPNVYRSLKSKISREVPTVTRSFQRQVDANDLRRDLENNNRRRVLEEYSDQRNRAYELLNTPEARRRAQTIDRKYGTEYNKVYDDLTKEYEDINSYVNLPEPNFVSNKKDYANIDPSKGKTINLSTDNIRTAEDYPKGLIRHEIGHYVDEKAYPGGVPNNAYLRQLGKPSKYRPFSEVEHMFPDKDRAKSVYEYLRKPTEKKSIMNQFDEYLMNTLTPGTYPTNTKQFRQVIESAPDLYNNMKMLLKIHTKPSVLYKDFLARPLVNKINKNKNQEIV